MGAMMKHDAASQLAALRSGAVSARELTAEAPNWIDHLNPGINAIVALRDCDVLLAEAEAERAAPAPLQGLPMAIKDLVETAGIVTTYGSPAFRSHVPATTRWSPACAGQER